MFMMRQDNYCKVAFATWKAEKFAHPHRLSLSIFDKPQNATHLQNSYLSYINKRVILKYSLQQKIFKIQYEKVNNIGYIKF